MRGADAGCVTNSPPACCCAVWPKRGNVFELATRGGLYRLHGDGMLGRTGAGQGPSGGERAQRVSSSIAYSKRTLVPFRDGAAT